MPSLPGFLTALKKKFKKEKKGARTGSAENIDDVEEPAAKNDKPERSGMAAVEESLRKKNKKKKGDAGTRQHKTGGDMMNKTQDGGDGVPITPPPPTKSVRTFGYICGVTV
ncbi:unnamed protein product, partial [Mesorhabditis spiculigera]